MKQKKIASAIAIVLAFLMVASLLLSVIPVSAFADELDDLKAERSALATKVEECAQRLQQLQSQQSNVLEQKAALEEQNRLAEEELKLIEKEIESYDKLIEEKAKEVESAKNKEANQLARYRARIRAMEESGGYNVIALISQSESFSQLITAIDDMGEIMDSDKSLQDEYIAAREETEEIKLQYEEEKAEYEADKDDLAKEQERVKQNIENTNQTLADLEDEIEVAKKEYEEAEAAEAAAAATIADMIAALVAQKAREEEEARLKAEQMQQANENAAANGETPPYSQEEIDAAGSAGSGVSSGDSGLMWPVPCSTRVTSRFGYRSDPFTGANKYHSGIDIDGFGNDGGAIVAAASGTVVTSSYDAGYGNYVIVDHGGMQTLYAHNSGNAVSVGDYVSQGQTIGYLGATGRATGTHCHFEVFVGGSRVDPAQYFSGISYYNC